MRNSLINLSRSSSNTRKTTRNGLATLLAKLLQERSSPEVAPARRTAPSAVKPHGPSGRKYLNREERRRFLLSLDGAPAPQRLFCLVLIWSGCRISEALALTPGHFDLDSGTVAFDTLKRRKIGIVRQVPFPPDVLRGLDEIFDVRAAQRDPVLATRRLWSWSRCTAWRNVKRVMMAAEVCASAAMPKGLRHTFGVAAFQTVPPHLVQRWMGHASLRTTAIYGDVQGPEEQSFAERIWRNW